MPDKLKVSLRNVSRSFVSPTGERIQALRDVSLEVEDRYSPDGRDILLELERSQIPDIVSSVVYAGGRIIETKIVQRKAEDMYTEIIMEGGR